MNFGLVSLENNDFFEFNCNKKEIEKEDKKYKVLCTYQCRSC